jgi:nucleotide-binding universal stress UspA family protein
VLLASEEREFSPEAIDLAAGFGVPVFVIAIARVHGTSLGFPHPGLLPTKAEWAAQHAKVQSALEQLRRRGVAGGGRVLGTRSASKRIVAEAKARGCDVIVMGADPPAGPFRADFMWSQEPYRVRRRAQLPVYLVTPG